MCEVLVLKVMLLFVLLFFSHRRYWPSRVSYHGHGLYEGPWQRVVIIETYLYV